MACIAGFFGEYRFLSNFWPSPIPYLGKTWPTVEHAYQAAKTHSVAWRLEILNAATPAEAKRLGRRAPMVGNWNETRLGVMEELIALKFFHHPDLSDLLDATAPAVLIEKNTWGDTFWGVCNGSGRNHLGRILMRYRDML